MQNKKYKVSLKLFPLKSPKSVTVQKMNCLFKDFFTKCDQIRSFLRIWSHLLKKFLMENFIFLWIVWEVARIYTLIMSKKYVPLNFGEN